MGKRFIEFVAALFACAFTFSAHAASTNLPNAVAVQQAAGDLSLTTVRRSDAALRDSSSDAARLSPAEHMRRAAVYMTNRAFDEARTHWQAVVDFYPQDPHVPEALFGIGRSYFQSKNYEQAYADFNRLAESYPTTKEGREGLNFSAASLLRLERFSEAASRYKEYVTKYPNGERIDTAHLNVIDTLREAKRSTEALEWVAKTRQRFAGTPTETNAMFAALRLFVAEGEWAQAVSAADQLSVRSFSKAVTTSPSEVAYLRAFSLEQLGKKEEAFTAYLAIPDGIGSYYGWLATQHLKKIANKNQAGIVSGREIRVNSAISSLGDTYPAPYRPAILRSARAKNLDPRFVLALIRQESVFRPTAKSPAGARGLLQLTLDAAQKYAPAAGINLVQEAQLYLPETSITLGAEYLQELSQLFPQMLEPVAASYNGGEDNVARWLKRAKQKDPGVFTSEIGFDETKDYVQKVMSNYRVYTVLYTDDLAKR